jgi:hypothetical protein
MSWRTVPCVSPDGFSVRVFLPDTWRVLSSLLLSVIPLPFSQSFRATLSSVVELHAFKILAGVAAVT